MRRRSAWRYASVHYQRRTYLGVTRRAAPLHAVYHLLALTQVSAIQHCQKTPTNPDATMNTNPTRTVRAPSEAQALGTHLPRSRGEDRLPAGARSDDGIGEIGDRTRPDGTPRHPSLPDRARGLAEPPDAAPPAQGDQTQVPPAPGTQGAAPPQEPGLLLPPHAPAASEKHGYG